MQFAVNEQLVGKPVDCTDPRLHQYLRVKLLNPVEERMHAVFVDSLGTFLAAEDVAAGSSGHLILRVRHIVHRALDLGSTGILIAHNHPSGSSQPSRADLEATERFKVIAAAIDLDLVDHLIVTTNSIYSLKQGTPL